ncbi:transposase family protein [Streptosporangium canum]|uniref:transposase family protein n=1 Tax=Streptosporangium canum TaxID=324952 RepID=UPI0033B8728B
MPLWVSDAEPGSVHDLTAAREHVPGALYKAAAGGLPTLADWRLRRRRHSHPGQTTRRQPASRHRHRHRTCNALLPALHCLGELGFALLTQRRRTLQRITAGPSRIGDIVKAALVLTHFEHSYPT